MWLEKNRELGFPWVEIRWLPRAELTEVDRRSRLGWDPGESTMGYAQFRSLCEWGNLDSERLVDLFAHCSNRLVPPSRCFYPPGSPPGTGWLQARGMDGWRGPPPGEVWAFPPLSAPRGLVGRRVADCRASGPSIWILEESLAAVLGACAPNLVQVDMNHVRHRGLLPDNDLVLVAWRVPAVSIPTASLHQVEHPHPTAACT